MQRFNPNVDETRQYDLTALTYLRRKYGDYLHQTRTEIIDEVWYQRWLHDTELAPLINWNSLARQLIIGFASADALHIDLDRYREWCVYYAITRVIPIQLLNSCIDDVLYDQKNSKSQEIIAQTGMLSVLAQFHGHKKFNEIFGDNNFWQDYVNFTQRVVSHMQYEFRGRFNSAHLHNPSELLALYDTIDSPLKRSSTLETLITACTALSGEPLHDKIWLQHYEYARQLLDDLADLWEDLIVGRINYPILLALTHPETADKLKQIISEIWKQQTTEPGKLIQKEQYWTAIKSLIHQAGGFQKSHQQIDEWLLKVENAIILENFAGDSEGLMVCLDLKKAYLARLKDLDYDNQAPPFDFFDK